MAFIVAAVVAAATYVAANIVPILLRVGARF